MSSSAGVVNGAGKAGDVVTTQVGFRIRSGVSESTLKFLLSLQCQRNQAITIRT